MDQIARDEMLSIQLFDEINLRDPLNNQPAYLYEKDVNSAKKSLRQIMAEQMAEEALEKSGVSRKPSNNFLTENRKLFL